MSTSDVSGKADIVLTTKGDLATWDTERVRKGVSATNYTGLQADSANADGLTYGATARSTMTGTADMIYSSAANTLARLAVGSALQVLQTNSATNALEWANSPQSLMGTTGDILSASSANTLSAISPSTSGHVLTSNGATTLPSFQAVAGGGTWETLGSTKLTTPTSPLAVTFAAREFLLIQAKLIDSSASSTACRYRFDDDTSSNYDYNYSLNGASAAITTSDTLINPYGVDFGVLDQGFLMLWINNPSTDNKTILSHSMMDDPATQCSIGSARLRITDQVTSIQILADGYGDAGRWDVDSEVVVLGYDP